MGIVVKVVQNSNLARFEGDLGRQLTIMAQANGSFIDLEHAIGVVSGLVYNSAILTYNVPEPDPEPLPGFAAAVRGTLEMDPSSERAS